MGNYRFKISDMMPNAWFYKLRDMSRAKKQNNSNKKTNISHPRRSIYQSSDTIRAENFFNSPTNPKSSDTHFPDFPKKSSKIRSKRKTIYKPSPRVSNSPVYTWGKTERVCPQEYLFSSSESSVDEFYESPFSETKTNSMEGRDLYNELSSWSGPCNCKVTSSTTDIFIDVNEKPSFCKKKEGLTGFDLVSEIKLRPILTKPSNFKSEKSNFRKQSSKEHTVKIVKESSTKPPKERKTSPGIRKSISSSTGVKLKSNSPKITNKKIRPCARKSVVSSKKSYAVLEKKSFSKSFAIVKSSIDPHRDFKDSMWEMIVENGISASEDLEELLACYLSLNSDEYHGVIVKAFEQIWFEMANLRL